MEDNIKFDLVDWIEVLIGTAFTLGMFMLDCMFLINPIKWFLVQLIFFIAPSTLGIGYLIRELLFSDITD